MVNIDIFWFMVKIKDMGIICFICSFMLKIIYKWNKNFITILKKINENICKWRNIFFMFVLEKYMILIYGLLIGI